MKAKSKQVKYALNRPLEFFTNKMLKKTQARYCIIVEKYL